MSENIELLKRVISNYAERHRNDEEKINWLYKERKKQTLEILSLEKELAALREKCRWQTQSEESAGDFLENDAPVECLDMKYGIPSVRISRCGGVDQDEYWRPLDLQELERIEGHKKRPEQEGS